MEGVEEVVSAPSISSAGSGSATRVILKEHALIPISGIPCALGKEGVHAETRR